MPLSMQMNKVLLIGIACFAISGCKVSSLENGSIISSGNSMDMVQISYGTQSLEELMMWWDNAVGTNESAIAFPALTIDNAEVFYYLTAIGSLSGMEVNKYDFTVVTINIRWILLDQSFDEAYLILEQLPLSHGLDLEIREAELLENPLTPTSHFSLPGYFDYSPYSNIESGDEKLGEIGFKYDDTGSNLEEEQQFIDQLLTSMVIWHRLNF